MSEDLLESAGLEISKTEFLRLQNVERFSDWSGYCCQISVRAGEFACHGRRFYFNDLPQFVEQLRATHMSLKGHAELRHRYEPEFLRFQYDSRGHVHVTGFLTDYGGRACSLRFTLEADQTFMPEFISGLERIVRELHA